MRRDLKNNLRLMLVTDTVMMRQRGLNETVAAAVAGGVTSVQLRDKSSSDRALIEMATALRELLAPRGIPLIINDRISVAQAVMADGLHIGQDDGDPAVARRLLGPKPLIGLSVTKAAELATVDACRVDYVGLGPVFATATKGDAAPALGLEETARIGRALPVPYVAIGGIDVTSAGAIITAGAAGIAVVSAICAADDPEEAAAALRRAMEGNAS